MDDRVEVIDFDYESVDHLQRVVDHAAGHHADHLGHHVGRVVVVVHDDGRPVDHIVLVDLGRQQQLPLRALRAWWMRRTTTTTWKLCPFQQTHAYEFDFSVRPLS